MNANRYLLFILLFPLFVAAARVFSIDRYANVIFLAVFGIFVTWGLSRKGFKLLIFRRTLLGYYFLFLSLTLCVLLNFNDFEYVFPLLFFLFLFILFHIIHLSMPFRVPSAYMEFVFVVYLTASVISLFFSSSFRLEGRFQGFAPSATTYSIYLIGIGVFVINMLNSKTQKIVTYVLFFFFIFLTKTRLNLAYFILVPVFVIIAGASKRNRFVFFILFLLGLFLIYPIYSFVILKYPELIEFRYSDGRDASFGLRYNLYATVVTAFWENELSAILFGNGWEASRQLILNTFAYDHMPHNDFIRLVYDFGIVGLLIFLSLIVRLSLVNVLTYQLGLLYLFSFYHNMVYSFFIVGLLVSSTNMIEKKISKNTQ